MKMISRLLKMAHLRGSIPRMGAPHAGVLAAAYRKYAWTHLWWVPRPARAAWHLDLFEQPGRKLVIQHSVGRSLRGFLAFCALAILAVGPAMAQDKAPAEDPSVSIPIPEIAARAEEVAALLRSLDLLLTVDTDTNANTNANANTEAIRQRLPELSKQIDALLGETAQKLDALPSIEVLDELLTSWQRMRGELARALEGLTQRATRLEAEMERLSGVLDTWKRTRADALTSKAPAPVLQRIDSLLAAIPGVQKRLRDERGGVLVLQDQVAHQIARCEEGLDQVATFRQGYVGKLLVRDTAPIWSREVQEQVWADIVTNARESFETSAAHLRQFVREESWQLLFLAGLFVLCIGLLRAARRRAQLRHLVDERGFSVELVFDRPVATALVVAMLCFFWVYPHPPRAVLTLVAAIALIAVIQSVVPLVEPWQIGWLRALGAFFLADLFRGLFAVVPRLERQLFLLEMLVGAAVVGWVLYRDRASLRRKEQGKTGKLDKLRAANVLLLVGFTASFLAGAAGYMSLGRQAGYGTLGSAYVALALSAGIRVVYGFAVLLLRVQPLRRLQCVTKHRALLEERLLRLLDWCAVAIWVWVTLRVFSLATTVVTAVHGMFTAELAWGSLKIGLGDVLEFSLTLWLAFLVSRFIGFVLEEDVYPRTRLAPGIPYAISSLLHYAILFAGFLLAVSALGLDLNKVTIIGGAFGVGIGFGLQNVVNNFVSGLIVLFERPVRVGDAVQIGDVSGQVRRIGIRSSTVRTWEGAEVTVPNATLVSDRVTNWTPTDRWRRISLPVGVSYGSDPEKVLEVLRMVACGHAQVLSKPAPQPLFIGFGESALLFELRVWTDGIADWQQVRSELAVALNAALNAAGIEIASLVRHVLLRQEPGGTVAPEKTGP